MAVHGEIGRFITVAKAADPPPDPLTLSPIRFRRQNGQTRGTINTVAMPTTMLKGVPKRM